MRSKADQYRKNRLGDVLEERQIEVTPNEPDGPLRGESFTHNSLNASASEVISGFLIIMAIAIGMVVGAISFVNFVENRRTGSVGSEEAISITAISVMTGAPSERHEQPFEMGPS